MLLAVFGKPTALSAAFGVPIALLGEALRCWAVGYSGVTTRGDAVEAPVLVTAGPYAYVRNPLYVGNVITAAGFTVAFTGALSPGKTVALAVAGLGTMLAVYATIVPHEEAFLRGKFGPVFDEYTARVPRVVPRPADDPGQGTFRAGVIRDAETRTFVTFGAMLVALAIKAAL